MRAPLDQLLSALREHGHELRETGDGWTCCCPAHDDRNPSLSIHAGDQGGVVWRCHAGCAQAAVIAAVGLTFRDLMPDALSRLNGHTPKPRRSGDGDETTRSPARGGGSVAVASVTRSRQTFATPAAAVAELERRHGRPSSIWRYPDPADELVGLVLRWNLAADPGDPKGKPRKRILPVSKTAAGWIIGGMPTPRPLYGLRELLATNPGARIYITEGEPAADAVRALGLTAITSPHGSKSAAKTDWSPVTGREVVILPDHDDAGDLYADDVARLARAAGAKSVRVVRLVELWQGMPGGGDVVDYLEHRGGDADAVRAEVEALTNTTDADTVTPEAPAVPAFKPFPAHVLPEPIRGFITEAAKAIGCDASYIALPLLSGLASAIGNTHRIELKRGWSEPAILWTAIVGESGTMKTPAFKLAMKATRKAQDRAWREHEAERLAWESESQRYDAAMVGWKRDAAKATRYDAYAIEPPERPIPPVARRYIVSDTTTEALAPILLGNPRGVLLARDELAGWLGSFDRYAKAGKAGADSAHWLSMHNGEAMTIDRKTGTPPTIHVPSASVSITGGIQPGILARALGQEHYESGMAARVLYAMPPRKAKRWTETDVDATTEAAVAAVFERLFALMPDTDEDGEDRPRLVTLDDDGKRAWVRFYNEHATEQSELSGDLSAAWSKLEGYAARLALVVHQVRCAAGDTTLRDPSRVDEASIGAGVMLARWFGDEAKRVYAILSETDDERQTRELVEWIGRHGGTVTVRQLTRGPREYRDAPDPTAKAEKALGELVAAGVAVWIHNDHDPKGGRPTDRVRLVSRRGDSGDGDETPVNAGNRVGSGTVAMRNDASYHRDHLRHDPR